MSGGGGRGLRQWYQAVRPAPPPHTPPPRTDSPVILLDGSYHLHWKRIVLLAEPVTAEPVPGAVGGSVWCGWNYRRVEDYFQMSRQYNHCFVIK